MADDNPASKTDQGIPKALRPLRIWPAIVLLALLWALRLVPRVVEEQTMATITMVFMGPAAASLLVMLWWVGFSRAAWKERLLGLLGVLAIGFVANLLADKSVQGFGVLIYLIPWGISAFIAALICLG